MKHLYFILLMLIVSAFTNPAHAQITGGGEEREPDEPQEINEEQTNQPSLLNYGVLKIGFANPTGLYATKPQRGDNFSQIFNNEAGFGAESSFSIGVYRVSSLGIGSQDLFDYNITTEIGYLYGINYSQNLVNWGDYVNFYDATNYSPYHYIDFKLGPVVAISPYPNLVFDLFYNAMFTMSIPAEMEFQYDVSGSSFYDSVFVDEDEFPYGIRSGIGLNIRYSQVIFSIERTWGNIDTVYKVEFNDEDFFSETFSYESVMNNSVTLVSLGILF